MITCSSCGEHDPERARFRVACGRARALAVDLGAEPIVADIDTLLEGAPTP
jgi:hypothetical protein